MRCRNCGAELEKYSLRCSTCSAPIEKGRSPLGFILVLFLILVTVAVFLFSCGKKGSSYDTCVNSGKQYISQQKYTEAIAEFDKAIKLKPSRPEAYMGKAEAMAYSPNMTAKEAQKIIEVLQIGYENSGEETVIRYKNKIGKIIEERGFAKEGEMLQTADVAQDKTFENKENENVSGIIYMQGDVISAKKKTFFISSGNIIEENSSTGEESVVAKGNFSSFVTDGVSIFAIDEKKNELNKIDVESGENTVVMRFDSEKTPEFCGTSGKYIYIKTINDKNRISVKVVDAYTSESFDMGSDVNVGEIISYDNKIYYNGIKEGKNCSIYSAKPDGSEETVIIEDVAVTSLIILNDELYFSEYVKNQEESSLQGVNIKTYNVNTKYISQIKNICSDKEIRVDFSEIGFAYYTTDEKNEIYNIELFNGKEESGMGKVYAGKSFFAVKTKDSSGDLTHTE